MSSINPFEKTSTIISAISALISAIAVVAALYIGMEQIKATKIQFSPVFTTERQFEKDAKRDIYIAERLMINNQGHPVTNFEARTESLITLTYTDIKSNQPKRKITIPVIYFLGQSTSSGGKGLMTTFFGHENLNNAAKFNKDVLKFNSENTGKIVDYKLDTIIKITYLDAIDENHQIYFLNDKIIPEKAYTSYKEKLSDKPSIHISELKLSEIISSI